MTAPRVPALETRYPGGCPDPDWCSGNGCCYWDCSGERAAADEEKEYAAEIAEFAEKFLARFVRRGWLAAARENGGEQKSVELGVRNGWLVIVGSEAQFTEVGRQKFEA